MKFSFLKPVTGLALMSLALLSIGCGNSGLHTDLLGPPGYSAGENATRQLRYAAFDQQQLIDDFDKNVTMSRPGGMLTTWNVSRSD
jgi:hypothetical protein